MFRLTEVSEPPPYYEESYAYSDYEDHDNDVFDYKDEIVISNELLISPPETSQSIKGRRTELAISIVGY